MSYAIHIHNERGYPLDESRLRQAVAAVLDMHELEADCGLSLSIEDDEAVQALNRQHRHTDAPTDVLSFPFEDDLPEEMAAMRGPYWGDLVIAYPYVAAQAARLGHDLGDSLALLAVHGTLHLLGYDHDSPASRAEMWEAQAEALASLGIDLALVPTLEDAPGGPDHA
jgi:probable rRNA maturation factor